MFINNKNGLIFQNSFFYEEFNKKINCVIQFNAILYLFYILIIYIIINNFLY